MTPDEILAAVAELPLGEQFEVLNGIVIHLLHAEGVDRAAVVEAATEAGR